MSQVRSVERPLARTTTAPDSAAVTHERDWRLRGSERMRVVDDFIDRVASTDATVLVSGESGVGKELVARSLHDRSPRAARPFVKVNCAALPAELLESELFGYERGAFTGATQPKPGKFELAHTGSIFLDEIAEMPLHLQAKLLHVLQDRQFSRLGSQREIRVDVRVIAATNKRLSKLVAEGSFRDDLYYRLNVMNIHVPPLRERREEIPGLIEYFLREYAREYGRPRPRLSDDTLRAFLENPWRGNVRELENLVKRIVALDSQELVAQEMTAATRAVTPNGRPETPDVAPPVRPSIAPAPSEPRPAPVEITLGLRDIARQAALAAEKQVLVEVLDRVHWHRLTAARLLKVSYKTLLQKIKQHGLETVAALVLILGA
ncbi:MAG: sigma 54-interacting transcriptional regulator [Candidatus Rokubacteria bacterium]|nr:sigma 54-interacting transcriptional regulator [Candidatus Rokubacteria bacterium]